MCGIAGIISFKPDHADIKQQLVTLNNTIHHRGPDGEGYLLIGQENIPCFYDKSTLKGNINFNYHPKVEIREVSGNFIAGFAHKRLAIIDVEDSGHQPMSNAAGEIWITYNGEIYNYLELRKVLESDGFLFRTSSDTEIIINAYKKWGEKCVDYFNGMWAFCIYDKNENIFFFSRDRLGVKPLYYQVNDNAFLFASEQKALVKLSQKPASTTDSAIYNYLHSNLLEYESNNFFNGINELLPGENLILNYKEQSVHKNQYFKAEELITSINQNLTDKEIIDLIEEKLVQAVHYRLRSDVEVGNCLSGGIDSSAIAGITKHLGIKNLKCFTASMHEGVSNEEAFARHVCDSIGGIHHITNPSLEKFQSEIENLIYALDAPIWDTSTYSQFTVMSLVKQNNIKVVLDGQGADELFGGYYHHFLAKWNQSKKDEGLFSFIKEVSASNKSIPNPFAFYFKQKIKQTTHLFDNSSNQFLNKEFVSSIKPLPINDYFYDVNQSLIADFGAKRLKSFLRCEDRCSMWHSIESRTPFSDDIELIRLAFSFNGSRKIQNGISKFLLREGVKKYIPSRIFNRNDKVGFETPMLNWVVKLQEQFKTQALNENFNFLNNELIKKHDFSKSLTDSRFLFKLYVLSIWKKVFQN
ncbi:MAG: asparagine synthase (glutamine-hydrolyzing) [Bacteroidia bacterium]